MEKVFQRHPHLETMCLGLEEQHQGSLGVGCSELLPSIPRVAVAAPECSLFPGALPWLGKADLN